MESRPPMSASPDAPTPSGETPSSDPDRPFRRLIPLQWKGELLAICGGMLASFLVAGFWYPYWRIADMDFWVVYNAFLLNAGLPQEYFEHPGYLSIGLLAGWLKALHEIGILQVHAFTALPPGALSEGFTAAWTNATQAGRVLSLIFAVGFVVTFSYLLRTLVRDWRIAAFGGFLLAFSGGMAMQLRIVRTELLAAGLFYTALLIMLIAARRGPQPWRPLLIGCASLAIPLALQNKIHILFLIGALPVVLLPFGPSSTATASGFWTGGRQRWAMLAAAVLAGVCIYLARGILATGLAANGAIRFGLPAIALDAPAYWSLIALWLAGGMAAYTIVWRVSAPEALTSACAVVAGCMVGLLALYVRYSTNNVMILFHPLELMYLFAVGSNPELVSGGQLFSAAHVDFLFNSVTGLIERMTFVLHSSPRPAIFLQWFVIVALVVAWRKNERRVVFEAGALMLSAWAIDLLGVTRGLKQEYFLLTDPLVILAAALLVAQVPILRRHRWTYPAGVALIAAHLVISQAEPVKHLFKSGGPEVLCSLYDNAQKVERLPACPKR